MDAPGAAKAPTRLSGNDCSRLPNKSISIILGRFNVLGTRVNWFLAKLTYCENKIFEQKHTRLQSNTYHQIVQWLKNAVLYVHKIVIRKIQSVNFVLIIEKISW